MQNYIREISDGITFRKRVVVYLPNKKVKTRQLAQDVMNLDKHRVAKCIEWFIDKPTQQQKSKPELKRAVRLANDRNADLLIPELGNLGNNLQFLSEITGLEAKVFYAAIRPRDEILLSRMDIETLAILSNNIRDVIRTKTKARLQELKLQGIQLGAPDPQVGLRVAHAASREYADDYARELMPQIQEIRALGYKTLTAIAKMLNARKVETVKGGKFHPTTVKNILTRAKYL